MKKHMLKKTTVRRQFKTEEVGKSVRGLGVRSAYQNERKRKLASKFTQALKKQLKGIFICVVSC